MTLKDKLKAVDPAKLEATPETDALVAEILGEPEPQEKATVASRFMAHRFWNTRIVVPESSDGECGYAWHPVDISKSLGLALEVLWPWLVGKNPLVTLTIWNAYKPAVMDRWLNGSTWCWKLISEARTWELALCRAVVSVEKARSR